MLLAARWSAARGNRPRLFVYTVDHALRPEAAGEAAMVAREASRLGLACRVLRWEGDKPSTGIQAAARSARYRLLAEARDADDAALVLTAHHLRDQAETVLMRLAHGSGVDGLSGMRDLSFVEGCKIGRPLLGVHPDQLAAIVAEAGLVPASDPGNADPAYERIRWRAFQPQLDAMGLTIERLGVFARRMDEAGDLIHAEADAQYSRIVEPVSATDMRLDAARLAALNPAVAVALLGQVMGLVKGDRTPPPLGPLELLVGKLQRREPLKGVTLHGCLVSSDGDSIRVRSEGLRRPARKATDALTPN
jgi:tRNA(Ile)-lysidine synthase